MTTPTPGQLNPSYAGWSDDDLRSSVTFLVNELARVDAGKSPYPLSTEYRGNVERDLAAGRAELEARKVHPGRVIGVRSINATENVTITILRVLVHPLPDAAAELTAYQVVVESPTGTWLTLFGSRAEVEAFLTGLKAWAAVAHLEYPSTPEIP